MSTGTGVADPPATIPGLVVRGIRLADAVAVQAFHRRLSADTIRNRFFGARVAMEDGIRRLVADTHADNRAMVNVSIRTPGAATVAKARRDGRVVDLIMAVAPPGGVLTWRGDDL